jgi:putative transposase
LILIFSPFSLNFSRSLLPYISAPITYGAIFLEDLSIKNMMTNHHLAKSIGDAAWNQWIQYCTYKAEDAGRVLGLVDQRGTSQRCSGCRSMVLKDLSVRVYDCPSCGLVLDRDLTAAINIERLGLESLSIALEAPARFAMRGE